MAGSRRALALLLPEWQGYGLSPEPADGARRLAERVWAGRDVLTIEAPRHEDLGVTGGVLGLDSIASRFGRTLAAIHASSPDRIMTIGATCGVELAPVAYLNDRYLGDLAVLWLDAHADLNTPESSPSGHFHGMVLRTLLGEGPRELVRQLPRALEPRQLFLAGARDLDPPEAAFVRRAGVDVFGAGAFDDPAAIGGRIRAAGFRRLYLHLDVDVLNPDDFAASLVPTPGGPTVDRVQAVTDRLFNDFDVVGSSVVEYCDRGAAPLERLRAAFGRLVGSFAETSG